MDPPEQLAAQLAVQLAVQAWLSLERIRLKAARASWGTEGLRMNLLLLLFRVAIEVHNNRLDVAHVDGQYETRHEDSKHDLGDDPTITNVVLVTDDVEGDVEAVLPGPCCNKPQACHPDLGCVDVVA